MLKDVLIGCFQDTLEKSQTGEMALKTAQAIQSNRVYKENFTSMKPKGNEDAPVEVLAASTFDAARKYVQLGKTAVLNFANPHNPGGGIHLGAMAQEECLCRSSNLYACISDQNVFADYYEYHRKEKDFFFSDRLIYTKNVTVFKDEQTVPKLLPEDAWFQVDVITCSAPYLGKRKHTNGRALYNLLKKRVKNIFESARDNEVEYLILGAFGCGAFKNHPKIVAQAFFDVFCEEDYKKDFKEVIFAIKPTDDRYCPNLGTFSGRFDCLAPDAGERCTILDLGMDYALYRRDPALPDEKHFTEKDGFHTWQWNNRYFAKQFSILGDSLSTLAGYNPKGYNVFYDENNCRKSGVKEAKDTWWEKVITFFGGELLVNNSWSGSRVTKIQERKTLFPSGCSNQRTGSLHVNDVMPDVIIVYLGTNDWAYGAKTGEETHLLMEDEHEYFNYAYERMIEKLKENYPQSEIWCCTLCETFISARPDFTFPKEYGGNHIESYNDMIRDAANRQACKLIDLYDYNLPYDTMDGSHPNRAGMNTIATMVIHSIADEHARSFLDDLLFQPAEDDMAEDLEDDIWRLLMDATPTGDLQEGRYFLQESLTIEDLSDKYLLMPVDILHSNRGTLVEPVVWMGSGQNGYIPMFTSPENIPDEVKYSCIRCKPEDYVPMLLKTEFDVIVNPYNKKLLRLKKEDLIDQLKPGMTKYQTKTSNSNGRKSGISRFVGKIISEKYLVVRLLGAGGTYETYLVEDTTDHRQYTMKICDKQAGSYKKDVADFLRLEYVAMKMLNHPAIPKPLEVMETQDGVFLLREYIEGESLKQTIMRNGKQSVENVIKWGIQLCEVLGYLHALHPPRIHRDVKPANIVLDSNSDLKLIDFGIMRTYKEGQAGDTCVLGTKGYAAPEQYGGRQTDARTDIYGIGMTLYQLVTGLSPTDMDFEIKPIRQIDPFFPVPFERIIEKCIELDPDRRYQTCEELKSDLEALDESEEYDFI